MTTVVRGLTAAVCAVVVLVGSWVAVAAQDASADDLKTLQGGWMVVAAEQRGRSFDAIRGGGLVIEGRTFHLKTKAGNEFRGDIRVDAATSPKQLDFVHANGGPVWLAIYTVDEDALRLNYVEQGDGATRPRLFATSADGGGTVIVLNRMSAQ